MNLILSVQDVGNTVLSKPDQSYSSSELMGKRFANNHNKVVQEIRGRGIHPNLAGDLPGRLPGGGVS